MVNGQQVPVPVKVISVMYQVGAVFGIISGAVMLFMAGSIVPMIDQIPLLGTLGTGFFAVGVTLILLSILGFFVGRGLWKAKPWARIAAIILIGLGALMQIISMVRGDFSDIYFLVFYLIIGGYLLFSSKVKETFV